MSEGDAFLHRAISDTSLLLRDPSSKPVKAADNTVRSFCTKELRGVPGGVGDVEEYIANATLDLIMMSVWSLAAGQVDLERLPVRPHPTIPPSIVCWPASKFVDALTPLPDTHVCSRPAYLANAQRSHVRQRGKVAQSQQACQGAT